MTFSKSEIFSKIFIPYGYDVANAANERMKPYKFALRVPARVFAPFAKFALMVFESAPCFSKAVNRL